MMSVASIIFGPTIWQELHVASYALPEQLTLEHQNALQSTILALRYTLPCVHCRAHWTSYVAEHPPNVESASQYQSWLVTAHNFVNRSTQPSKREWTERESRAYWLSRMYSTRSQLKAIEEQDRIVVEQERSRELENDKMRLQTLLDQTNKDMNERDQRHLVRHAERDKQARELAVNWEQAYIEQARLAERDRRLCIAVVLILSALLLGVVAYHLSIQ
jgi:hypothetical protein